MEEAAHPHWSGLPQDLMAMVMRSLDIPDLFHAGAVCTSWYAAYSAVRRVRIPIKDAAPCLLYSCADDDADTATMYSPATGAAFKVRLLRDLLRAGGVCASWRAACSEIRLVRFPITDSSPCLFYSSADAADDADTATIYSPATGAAFKVRLPAPAFRSRHVVGSAHGWVVTADEASNLQAFNPLTGAQVDLPPVTGLHHVEPCPEGRHGHPAYNLYDRGPRPTSTPTVYTARELRTFLYHRVFLSCSPSAGAACIVLLVHKQNGEMSYARIGDARWALITTASETVPWDGGYLYAAYNDKDGLWYVLSSCCCIYAFDLNGPSPTARKIIQKGTSWDDTTSYIVFSPWGDILHVGRNLEYRTLTTPVRVPVDYAHEVMDPCAEAGTYEMNLYKVDVVNEKVVEIGSSDLQGHVLFLGFNSAMLVSTKDFPRLRPNCAYLTDDYWEQLCINMFSCRDVGIWNFETEKLESLIGDVESVHPWLNWPPPIWIKPSLSL